MSDVVLNFQRNHSGGRGRDEVTIHGHTGYVAVCVENFIDGKSCALACAHLQRDEVAGLIEWLRGWDRVQDFRLEENGP